MIALLRRCAYWLALKLLEWVEVKVYEAVEVRTTRRQTPPHVLAGDDTVGTPLEWTNNPGKDATTAGDA